VHKESCGHFIQVKNRSKKCREAVSCVWLYWDRYWDWFSCSPEESPRGFLLLF